MSEYFFTNQYLGTNLEGIEIIDKAVIAHRIIDFLEKSYELLLQALNNEPKYSLYTGKVGIFITLFRLKKFLQKSSEIRFQFDKSLSKLKKLLFTENCIGICSNSVSEYLLFCLLNDEEFHVERILYSGASVANEILYGKSGLALMIDYFSKKGVRIAPSSKREEQSLVQSVISFIHISDYPWSWHDKGMLLFLYSI
jgi:hypothetical protein